MPNWCDHSITVVGTPYELDRFLDRFEAEVERDDDGKYASWTPNKEDRNGWITFDEYSWLSGVNPVVFDTYTVLIGGTSAWSPPLEGLRELTSEFALEIYVTACTESELYQHFWLQGGEGYLLEEWVEIVPEDRRVVIVEDGIPLALKREEQTDDDPVDLAELAKEGNAAEKSSWVPRIEHYHRAIARTDRRIEESIERAKDGVTGFLGVGEEVTND